MNEKRHKWRDENKEKNREIDNRAARAYYRRNKTFVLSKNKVHQKNKKIIKENIKKNYGCLNPNCQWKSEIPSYCLDFHHKSNKKFNLGSSHHSLKSQLEEINKCTILCAMCHRMETYGDLDASTLPNCNVDEKGNPIKNVL